LREQPLTLKLEQGGTTQEQGEPKKQIKNTEEGIFSSGKKPPRNPHYSLPFSFLFYLLVNPH
jgi:hypothetical protein